MAPRLPGQKLCNAIGAFFFFLEGGGWRLHDFSMLINYNICVTTSITSILIRFLTRNSTSNYFYLCQKFCLVK